MGAAGNDLQCHTGTPGQQQAGNGEQRLRAIGMVRKFQAAIVNVNTGISGDVGIGHNIQHLVLCHPKAGRNASSLLENVVVIAHGIQAHQAAHRRTGNAGMLPVGQRGIIGVNVWLERVHQPIHVFLAAASD